jgi:hypothetical protein
VSWEPEAPKPIATAESLSDALLRSGPIDNQKSCASRTVVSHVSRKTSEMWGAEYPDTRRCSSHRFCVIHKTCEDGDEASESSPHAVPV